jgi:NADH-quinone oxidoreductase subunit E
MAFTPDNHSLALAIIRQYPSSRSAIMPLAHLAQDQDGWLSPAAITEIAALLDLERAEVFGTVSFYTMYKLEPVGRLIVSVSTCPTAMIAGAYEVLHALEERFARDPDVHVEEVECGAACDRSPYMQVNYEFHEDLTPESAIAIVEEYKSGARVARGVSGGEPTGTEIAGGRI